MISYRLIHVFLIEHSAFPLFGSFTVVSDQTLNDIKSLFNETFKRGVDLILWSFRRLTFVVFLNSLQLLIQKKESPVGVMQNNLTVPHTAASKITIQLNQHLINFMAVGFIAGLHCIILDLLSFNFVYHIN